MSDLIQTISYASQGQKKLVEKLVPLVGTGVKLVLLGEVRVEGVIEEVGSDYLALIPPGGEQVQWIPFTSVLFLTAAL